MPYLGTYLTVLMMLDTALTDTVEVSAASRTRSRRLNYTLCRRRTGRLYLNVTLLCSLQGGLINFEKHRRVRVFPTLIRGCGCFSLF